MRFPLSSLAAKYQEQVVGAHRPTRYVITKAQALAQGIKLP